MENVEFTIPEMKVTIKEEFSKNFISGKTRPLGWSFHVESGMFHAGGSANLKSFAEAWQMCRDHLRWIVEVQMDKAIGVGKGM